MVRPRLVLDLSEEVYQYGVHGLQSLEVHPDPEEKPYLYLLYSVSDVDDERSGGAFGRVTRYTFDPVSMDVLPGSRKVFIGDRFETGIPACTSTYRTGVIRTDPAAALLVATSDGADRGEPDRGGLQPECFGSGKFSRDEDIGAFRAQSPGSLAGKLLRLDPETGRGLPDNPFYAGDGSDPASMIWAAGLREPVDIVATDLPLEPFFVVDRGKAQVEELNRIEGATNNFGWPCNDGFDPLDAFAGHALAQDFCPTTSQFSPPALWWHHQNPAFSNPAGLGANRLAGAAYYAGARYPDFYEKRLFLADDIRGWMATVRLGEQGEAADQQLFSVNPGAVAELRYNPHDQYIYFIDRRTDLVHRLRHRSEAGLNVTAPAPSSLPAAGQGLYGTYFDEADFSGDRVTRIDPALDYDSFQAPEFDVYNAVRWEALLAPEHDGLHVIYLTSKGSSRLWIDGALVIDNTLENPAGETATPGEGDPERSAQAVVLLEAGETYLVRIVHYARDDAVKAGLEWSSARHSRQVIPPEHLLHTYRERINLCRTAQARITLSSTLSPFAAAGNACDGDTNGDFFEGSVAVSQHENDPHLDVDLGDVRDVGEVRLWERTDCCAASLEGAFVFVSETPFTARDLTVLSQPGVSAYVLKEAINAQYRVPVDRPARYVRVQRGGLNTLFVAEVEIAAGIGNEQGAPPVEGLVAWWPFDEGAADRRGSHDGLLKNGAETLFDAQRRRVLELDGADDRVEVPHHDRLNGTHELTYAFWIKADQWGDRDVLFSKSMGQAGQMQLYTDGGQLVGEAHTTREVQTVIADLPEPGVWTHISLVFTGNRLRLYLNGALNDEQSFDYVSLKLNTSSVHMGGAGSDGGHMRGRLDDAVLYTAILDAPSIGRLMDAAIGVSAERESVPDGPQPSVSLNDAFPNPFSRQATIQYSVKSPGSIDLRVYDAIGRHVRTLERGVKNAGTYSIDWDGADNNGRSLSAGVYIVVLRTGGTVLSSTLMRL